MGDLIKNGEARKLDRWQACALERYTEEAPRRKRCLSPAEIARESAARAAKEAEAILAAATEQAKVIKNNAYEEGRAAALAELDAAQREARARVEELETEVRRQMHEFWEALKPELLKLSTTIASKIVRREVQENEDFVIRTVEAGLRQLRDKHELKIRVHPDDYDLARARKSELTQAFDDARTLDFVADRRVDKGGCIIESVDGNLDARISTQLEGVEAALLEAEENGGESSAA
ncbi:MAG: FliH/SctL family protein [Armatimonadota bacterium]